MPVDPLRLVDKLRTLVHCLGLFAIGEKIKENTLVGCLSDGLSVGGVELLEQFSPFSLILGASVAKRVAKSITVPLSQIHGCRVELARTYKSAIGGLHCSELRLLQVYVLRKTIG